MLNLDIRLKAYYYMKQFTVSGRNILDHFKEMIGDIFDKSREGKSR
jgi:hypothetical protein